jgi:magnesium chelatase family protein
MGPKCVSRTWIQNDTTSQVATDIAPIREQIARARGLQIARLSPAGLVTNSEIGHKNVDMFCVLEPSAERLLQSVINQRHLSLRAYHKIKKISRTIADLDNTDIIADRHIAEAMALRVSDVATPTQA